MEKLSLKAHIPSLLILPAFLCNPETGGFTQSRLFGKESGTLIARVWYSSKFFIP